MNQYGKQKVIAYITNQDRLLLFRHTAYPEAGIQVPAGTVEADEDLGAVVLREATEESGLHDFSLVSYLGQRDFEFSRNGDTIRQHRHFFHLILNGDAPETWLHWEEHPSEGLDDRIEFAFFWVPLFGNLPALAGAQDAMLPELVVSSQKVMFDLET